MVIWIFLLILLLSLATIGFGTLVAAIATRKLWLIPAVGGAVLLGLIGLGLFASIFFVGGSHTAQAALTQAIPQLPQLPNLASSVSFPTETIAASPPNWAAPPSGVKINLTWLVIFGVILCIVLLRSLFGRRNCHGIARAWPVLVVLGFLAVFSLVPIRQSYERSKLNSQMFQEAAKASAAQAQFAKRQGEQQMLKSQAEAAALQQTFRQHPGAKIVSQRSGRPPVANDDILELMDEFDQPRIPVSPEVPTPPSPPAPTAAPPVVAAPAAPAPTTAVAITAGSAADGAAMSVETKKSDTNKPSSSSQKRRKPKSDNAKPAAQAVAASKPVKDVRRTDSQDQKGPVEQLTEAVSDDTLAGPTKARVRPAWVDQPPKRVGNGVQTEVIVTDLWSSEMECDHKRDMLLIVKVYEHLQRIGLAPELDLEYAVNMRTDDFFYRDPSRGLVQTPQYTQARNYLSGLGITLDYARREMAKEEYLEPVDKYSVGPMLKLYTLVEFSPQVDREFRKRWESRQRSAAFKTVSFGALSLLGLLGCVFGLLKVDTWTKGYYTKRLFIGVPLAILGVFGLFLLLVV